MTNTVAKKLDGVDVTVILDRSGSMALPAKSGRSRWAEAEEGTVALAGKAAKHDPDGITFYTFANTFKKYESVGPQEIARAFTESEPNGGTNLSLVLADYFADFAKRKSAGSLKPNGEICLVITDGIPDSGDAVKKEIIAVSKLLDADEELGILFVQIGDDAGARQYLKSLDDDLKDAKFDIVNTLTSDEVSEMSLTEVLASAFED